MVNDFASSYLAIVIMVTYYEPLGYFVHTICLCLIQMECIHLECVISLGVASKTECMTQLDDGGTSTLDVFSEKPQPHSEIEL